MLHLKKIDMLAEVMKIMDVIQTAGPFTDDTNHISHQTRHWLIVRKKILHKKRLFDVS